jgi:FkbM family methyltransferase
MRLLDTFKFLNLVLRHPLNVDRKFEALTGWLKWHVGSRLVTGAIAIPFVNDTYLLAVPSLSAATENIYTGLAEFEDMSFLLHLLRPEDVFVDIGANIGSYTVLASGVCKSTSISFEPIPSTFSLLRKNVDLNGIANQVQLFNIGLGDKEEKMFFTKNLDSMNHAATEDELASSGDLEEVSVSTLDRILDKSPTLLKIDVEGLEAKVLEGAKRILRNESLLAVIIELNGCSEKYASSDKIIHEILLSYGFRIFTYSPFERKLILNDNRDTSSRNVLYLRNYSVIENRVMTAEKFCVLGQTL